MLVTQERKEAKERKANADFSEPVYFSPIGIYVRYNETRFDDFDKINIYTCQCRLVILFTRVE